MSADGVFVADGVAAEDFLKTVHIQQGEEKRLANIQEQLPPPRRGEERVDPARNE